jgi:phosphoribosylaminoimidazolecarboxamide formyltransferase/IMP cyclohydrolase
MSRTKRVLISVSDKTSIVDFASDLASLGIEIISTGGTADKLKEAGIKVTEISEIAGFPELLGGRVKTLHPRIHAAILADRENPQHVKQLETYGIEPIDMVVVNLYPFAQVVNKPNSTLEEAMENIDIGGHTLMRAAAKNWKHVTVVPHPNFYEIIVKELKRNNCSVPLATRYLLAVSAFTMTYLYEGQISSFFQSKIQGNIIGDSIAPDVIEVIEQTIALQKDTETQPKKDNSSIMPESSVHHEQTLTQKFLVKEELENPKEKEMQEENRHEESTALFPKEKILYLKKTTDLRYGENPHQSAALYRFSDKKDGVANAVLLQGKEMSYNNYLDADAAWNLICEFMVKPACAIIKHTNPCGVGLGETLLQAYEHAFATDPVSAFGGIVAFNKVLDAETAEKLTEVFLEVIVAPDFSQEALDVLKRKKNLRLLAAGETKRNNEWFECRRISGGVLIQTIDDKEISEKDLQVVTNRKPSKAEINAMLFAWKVCKHVKSNAIVIANEFQTLGVGAGQTNRLDSIKIAAMRAERFNLPLKGTVLASDAFFPFRDNVDEAAKHGISAIIQPGGSVRDKESIEAANEHGISMVFTGVRHFKH